MKALRIAGLAVCVAAVASAQRLDPVQWSMTSSAEVAQAGSTVPLKLTAKIEPGWHLYSLTIPQELYPTKITMADNPAVESSKVYQPPPVRTMDPNFKQEVETYSNQAEFWIPATLTKDASGPVEMTAQVRYRACDDKQCLNPRTKTASYKLTVGAVRAGTCSVHGSGGIHRGEAWRGSCQRHQPRPCAALAHRSRVWRRSR